MQANPSQGKEAFSKNLNSPLEVLRSSLLKKWEEKKVDICYQNMVLSYLNDMSSQQAQQQIRIEKQKVGQNKTDYLKIQRLKQQRQLILNDFLDNLKTQNYIRQTCDNVDKLRKINLKICQAILGLRDSLRQRNIKTDAISKGYGQFLLKLNQDNKIINNSYMSKFVQFAQGYDPLFLHPFERFQAGRIPDDTPQPILRLFRMNISYVYRLIKAKKQINQILSEKNKDNQIQNDEYNRQSQDQAEQYINSQKLSKVNSIKIRKNRKIILPSHKYQTITHEQSQDNDILKNYSIRVQSQPKKSLRNSFVYQQIQKKQRLGPKKFRVREKNESQQKSSSLRFRTQNYDHAQDEDINEFRRKMFERRARRKKLQINIQKIQQQDFVDKRIVQKKRNSINYKKFPQSIIQSPSISTNLKKNINFRGEQQISSEQEQLMQSRNLEQNIKTSQAKQKFNKIRYNLRKRTQHIRLQPLDKPKAEPIQQNKIDDDDQLQLTSHLSLSKNFEEKKIKYNYFPLSPEIAQMNKQSSSGKSQQQNSQSQQTYTSHKKQQLFQDANMNEDENDPNFRVKKLQGIDLTKVKHKSMIKQYSEQQELNPIDQKKFKDEHLRNPKHSNHPAKNRQSQSRRQGFIGDKNQEVQQKHQELIKPKQKISRLQINKLLQQKCQRQRQNPPKQQDLPTYRYRIQTQSNYPSNIAPHRVVNNNKILQEIEQMEQNKNKNKQIKLKPGQIKIDDLFSFIQRQKINQFQRRQFEVGLWKENIMLKHSYLTKFYMNSELAAFGISSPRCDGDYSILYWGTTCAENFTFFLFKKYLDYLQKFTSLDNIYIQNSQYTQADFQKKGSMYQRKRKNFEKRLLPYSPFLSLQCSNICFRQQPEKQNSIFFYSQQIQQFSGVNSLPSTFVGFCDPESATALPTNAQFRQKISSIAEVNSLLQKLQIDTYATSQKIQINQCKVFILKDHCAINSNYFYIRNGYFAPKGTQVYSRDKEKIMKLDMDKEKYSLFFGKKFKNIQNFVSNCSFNPGPDHFFAFKMFSKQLYGRLKNKQFTGEGCYGNWDINFLWQDQLKGTVIKDMPSPEYIYGPQSFYVALFKAESFIFAFEVQPSDFFF